MSWKVRITLILFGVLLGISIGGWKNAEYRESTARLKQLLRDSQYHEATTPSPHQLPPPKVLRQINNRRSI